MGCHDDGSRSPRTVHPSFQSCGKIFRDETLRKTESMKCVECFKSWPSCFMCFRFESDSQSLWVPRVCYRTVATVTEGGGACVLTDANIKESAVLDSYLLLVWLR